MSDYVMVRRELLEDIISTLDYEGATSWTEALRSSLAPVVLDDGDLTEIARDAALASVDRHNYMPATREDANN